MFLFEKVGNAVSSQFPFEPRPFQHKPRYSLLAESTEFTSALRDVVKQCVELVNQQDAIERWESEGGAP